ncbi:hypothetical protein [Catellatospora sp. NPDC049609]|uniref:hypothetical protein n=1 Tax=Catellatospora sp. NPDC049609 TaxID=3155505 RepID=UPI003422F716
MGYHFHLPAVQADRSLSIGPATLLPAGQLQLDVERQIDAWPARNDGQQALHDEILALAKSWAADATLEVTASDHGEANRLADEAMAILRLFVRSKSFTEMPKIARTGEIINSSRQTINIEPGEAIGARWQRIDGHLPFRFSEQLILDLQKDQRLDLLGRQMLLPLEQRSHLGQRAITALTVLDLSYRSLEPTVQVLGAAIAVETMFSSNSGGSHSAQALPIARRVAYLSCRAECGRTNPACPYIQVKKANDLQAQLLAAAGRGDAWLCTAFVDVAAPREIANALADLPLFAARNEIAHMGRTTLDTKRLRSLRWLADEIVMMGLSWLADRPDEATIADLDAEIDEKC